MTEVKCTLCHTKTKISGNSPPLFRCPGCGRVVNMQGRPSNPRPKGPPPPPHTDTAGKRPRIVHDIQRVRSRRQVLLFLFAATAMLAWSAGLLAIGISIGRLQGAVDCIKQQIGRSA